MYSLLSLEIISFYHFCIMLIIHVLYISFSCAQNINNIIIKFNYNRGSVYLQHTIWCYLLSISQISNQEQSLASNMHFFFVNKFYLTEGIFHKAL